MKMILFAGKFTAALIASIAMLFVISTGVDMIYGPVGTPVAQAEKAAQPRKPLTSRPILDH